MNSFRAGWSLETVAARDWTSDTAPDTGILQAQFCIVSVKTQSLKTQTYCGPGPVLGWELGWQGSDLQQAAPW
jgi:hypothetical protein